MNASGDADEEEEMVISLDEEDFANLQQQHSDQKGAPAAASAARAAANQPDPMNISDANKKRPAPPKFALALAAAAGGGSGRKLMINVAPEEVIDLDKSYEVSKDGTLNIKGFQIKASGITKAPDSGGPDSARENKEDGGGAAAGGSVQPRVEMQLADIVALGAVGKGACGTVLKATISVAEKEKRHQLVAELTALSALQQQASTIISFFGAFYSEGQTTLALEYMNRFSLSEIVKQHGALNELMLQHVALHSIRALAVLHAQHLVHRDIKPGNLLINAAGEVTAHAVKLADFGVLAALEGTADLATTYVGTTIFMSPERIKNEKYGAPSDIWSIGCTLFSLATAQLPYNSDGGYWGIAKRITDDPPPTLPTVREANGALRFSQNAQHFVQMCLFKDSAQRWNARQLLEHPWLQHADATWEQARAAAAKQGKEFMPFQRGLASDAKDVHDIAAALCKRLYADPQVVYKQSLMDQARLQRIALDLSVPLDAVRQVFERVYFELRPQEARGQQGAAAAAGGAAVVAQPAPMQQQPQAQQQRQQQNATPPRPASATRR